MIEFNWKTPAKDQDDFRVHEEAIGGIDVIDLLKTDPRDEILGDLLYYHPNPFPVRSQIDGGIGVEAVLGQLIVSDMICAGLVCRTTTGDLGITEAGMAFADARLIGPDVNSIYRVRDNAPPYGPFSAAASIAIKHLILHTSPYVEPLLTDVYHPVLGRATFD